MVNIEQVRLLESRVGKAIDYVNKVTDENTLLKNKLDGCQKRIEELEVLIQRFKEDQGRIEEGIISALNHLNRFEGDGSAGASAATASAPAGATPAAVPVAAPEPVQVSASGSDGASPQIAGDETLDDLSAAYTEAEPAVMTVDGGGGGEPGRELDIF
jgi:hypothetical protein